MDWQSAFNVAASALGVLGAGILRTLWSAQVKLADDMAKLQQAIADNYVRRDDFRDFRDQLFAQLQRIEDKVEAKVDK